MKRLFLIIGAPGSGKTTDAELIAERNAQRVTHYSTGDLLRAEVASGSERGQIIDSYISKGLIVPIEIAIETIVTAIKAAPTEIILFDGYPRSVEQMRELDTYLGDETEVTLAGVIEVAVGEAVAKERVIGRARGADDDLAVFNRRMTIYIEPLAEIRNFYTQKALLRTIDGERDLETVVDEMQRYVFNA